MKKITLILGACLLLAAPVFAEEVTLQQAMQQLGKEAANLQQALLTENLPAAAQAAQNIAGHAQPTEEEHHHIHHSLGKKAKEFQEWDHQVHHAAHELAQAAQAKDLKKAQALQLKMLEGCYGCHTLKPLLKK